MVRSSRIHRLPQRLDYTLIPAPLDLTLPLVDEKSPLPAIIVTPSSPRCSTDFSIAFLAPEPKPSLRERAASYLSQSPLFSSEQSFSLATTPRKNNFPSLFAPSKTRSIVVMFILIFVMACHLIAHRFASAPRMDFQTNGLGFGRIDVADAHTHGGLAQSQPNVPHAERDTDGLGFWERRDDSSDFVVTESSRAIEDASDALPNLA